MGHGIGITLLFILIFFSGCQSRGPVDGTSLPPPSPERTLEDLLSGWDEYIASLQNRNVASEENWQEQLQTLCSEQENLCRPFGRNQKRQKRQRQSNSYLKEIPRHLKDKNFEALSSYSISQGLKFFSRQKKVGLIQYTNTLLQDNSATCLTLGLKHALASTLEDFLPEEDARASALLLYEANSRCDLSARATALSSYRAAMLRLLDRNCAQALPLLEKVSSSHEDSLKPRSLYWTWKCQGDSKTPQNIVSQLPYFSYHRLLVEQMAQLSVQDPLFEVQNTPVRKETLRNPSLNKITALAEHLFSQDQTRAARIVLEHVNVEALQKTEPEYQVYWAYLLHKARAGVRKFQILSSLVNNYPALRSGTVKGMLFPTWYFDYVSNHSEKVDPWLVLSLIRQESAFDPSAQSPVGALGLMQLMPRTARIVARVPKRKLRDPEPNVKVGIKFLERLIDRYDGQVHLALAAYNAGPGKVDEWAKRYPTDDILLFVDTIPYRETREYVAFILRNYHYYLSLNKTTSIPLKVKSKTDSFEVAN